MRAIVNSFIVLGLAISFVSSLIMIIVFFNLGFVTDRIALAEPNQLIAQTEAMLAVVGFVGNLFIIRYVLKDVLE